MFIYDGLFNSNYLGPYWVGIIWKFFVGIGVKGPYIIYVALPVIVKPDLGK